MEVVTVKTTIDLFKELLGLKGQHDRKKKVLLEHLFTPLFVRMENVAKDYYGAIIEVRSALQAKDTDYRLVLERLLARRSSLIMVRDGVVGEAMAYGFRYRKLQEEQTSIMTTDLNKLISDFADSIPRYFEVFKYIDNNLEPRSSMSSIADQIQFRILDYMGPRPRELIVNQILELIEEILKHLENSWRSVVGCYSDLRLFCLA